MRGGDVDADAERGVGQAAPRLRHPDDVRALLERLRAEAVVRSSSSTSMSLNSAHSTRRLASASLRWPVAERDHVRLRVVEHPVVELGVERGRAALRTRGVDVAAEVHLELVVEHLRPVGDDVLERRLLDDVLDLARARRGRRTAGRSPVPGWCRCTSRPWTSRGRRAGGTSGRRTGPSRPSPRPRRGRASCRRRRCRPAAASSASGHQSLIGRVTCWPIAFERRLVEVDARLVPLQPQVVLDARVVRLGRRLDQRRRRRSRGGRASPARATASSR